MEKSAPVGRPTKYKPEYVKQAYNLCLLGATNEQLAAAFDVTTTTIDNWISGIPEFLGAIKAGREEADAKVVKSLYQRAKGYSHPDVHIAVSQGDVIKTEITKHYAPDTTACIFWLKNRRPKEWRDKQDIEHTGRDGGPIEFSDIERSKRIAALLDRARDRRDRPDPIDE